MAIKSYKKGTSTKLSANFNSTEFDCHGSGCCSATLVDEKLVEYLQKIRSHFGKPVNISSAYHCATHNKNMGDATGSFHMKGQAADIYIAGVTPAEIAKYAESIGILGIGLYETNADGYFVHIDTRTSKSFWYGKKQAKRTTFGDVIIEGEKVEDIKEENTTPKELYRVRKSWSDTKSQIGAYSILQNAKNACDKAGNEYYVFDSKGNVIYPTFLENLDTSKVNTAAADPEVLWTFFKKQGFNDYGIAGLMGNLYAESGLKPTNLQNTYEKSLEMTDAEYTAAVDSGVYDNFINDKAGYGLAQWTYYSRKQNLLNYCKSKNKSIGDLSAQLEFLIKELNSEYSAVVTTLKNATSVLEASNAVLLKFERPANQSQTVQDKRASYGLTYFNKYGSPILNDEIQVPREGENGKMKYSTSNKPLVCMQTQSTCYKGTSTMTIKGILWHSTGTNNPNLKRYVQPSDNAADKEAWLKLLGTNINQNDWNHITRQAGLNCWIGKLADGTVITVQTMPWNYKPWGCGSGSKGSCNNGWIQFEICEDSLNNKDYFDKVYQEACEITAYLCEMYNINPKGTVTVNGVKVPTILCHADSYKLGFGSNNGDVLHWFSNFGKSMDDVRKDVAKLMDNTSSVITPVTPEEDEKELYRVRKAWTDAKSQIGAYSSLQNAKTARDKAGAGYFVFNSKGDIVYPIIEEDENEEEVTTTFKVGDAVRLVPGSKYSSGVAIPAWVFKYKLYVREIRKNGDIIISTQKSGAITGVVKPKSLVLYSTTSVSTTPTFTPYLVRITTTVLNVRSGAGINYKINTQVRKNEVYTIVDEKNGWGKLKSGAGWIHLDYTKKI